MSSWGFLEMGDPPNTMSFPVRHASNWSDFWEFGFSPFQDSPKLVVCCWPSRRQLMSTAEGSGLRQES